VLQVARAAPPNDIKQFRRLTMQVKPLVNWAEFGKTLWYWGPNAKRQLVEQYYLAKFEPAKGGSK
jgi:CRISPR system Cascade subunit CasB